MNPDCAIPIRGDCCQQAPAGRPERPAHPIDGIRAIGPAPHDLLGASNGAAEEKAP